MIAADIMNRSGLGVTANAAEFDIDDPASADLNRFARVRRRMNGLVETNRRRNLFLKRGMLNDVFVMKRLLEHHEIVWIHFLENFDIGQRVRRIGVTHQKNLRKRRADLLDHLDIPAWLDLYL